MLLAGIIESKSCDGYIYVKCEICSDQTIVGKEIKVRYIMIADISTRDRIICEVDKSTSVASSVDNSGENVWVMTVPPSIRIPITNAYLEWWVDNKKIWNMIEAKRDGQSIMSYIALSIDQSYKGSKELQKRFYTEIVERQLRLFSLKYNKFDRCKLFTLFTDSIIQPLRSTKISLADAIRVAKLQKKVPTEDEIQMGKILRGLQMDKNLCFQSMENIECSMNLVEQFNMSHNHRGIFIKSIHDREIRIAERCKQLLNMPIKRRNIILTDKWSDEQKILIHNALTQGLTIVNAGGGTGKSTTICEIVKQYEKMGVGCKVVTQTGVASIRLIKDGIKSSTIHKLLMGRNRDQYMSSTTRALVIDEAGMITAKLFDRLLRTFPYLDHLVLAGDHRQLDPIGRCPIFQPLCGAYAAAVHNLTKSFRFGSIKNCQILNSANMVLNGEVPKTSNNFIVLPGNLRILEANLRQVVKLGYTRTRVKILSYHHDDVDILNALCQRVVNGSNIGNMFKVDDIVLSTQNNYRHNIANGSQGIVVGVGESILVDYGHVVVSYSTTKELAEGQLESNEEHPSINFLTLGYSITIPKSQGSEYDCVFIYVSKERQIRLHKRTMNTAITRAKQLCLLFCDTDVLEEIVKRDSPVRHCQLESLLMSSK